MKLKISPMTEKMQSVCNGFYSEGHAADYTFKPIPVKGTDEAVDGVAIYRFEGFDASLIFNAKLGRVKNVLECRIALNEGEKYVDFSLYDLMYLLDENDFNCYLFPYIDTPERLEACLKVLWNGICRYKDTLNGIGSDTNLCQKAKAHKKQEMLRFFKHNIFLDIREENDPILIWRLRTYREWYVGRFCSSWYGHYMNSNYEKAAKRLGSFDSKCDYELRIHRFLKTLSAGASYTPAPEEANTFVGKNLLKKAHFNSAFIIALIIGIAASFTLFNLFGYALYFAIYYNALYCTALYGGWIPMAALLCAIPTGVASAHLIWRKLLSKKEYETLRVAQINFSETEKRARRGSLHSSIICSLIVMLFAAKSGIALYDSGIIDNTALFESNSMPYIDVKAVIYERQTDLYHISFKNNNTFTCSSAMAKDYMLNNIAVKVTEVDNLQETAKPQNTETTKKEP